jgi:hypothetical protein
MQSRRVTRDSMGVRCTFLNIIHMFGRIQYFRTWDGWLFAWWCKAKLALGSSCRPKFKPNSFGYQESFV